MIDQKAEPHGQGRTPGAEYAPVAWFTAATTISTILILLLPLPAVVGPLVVVFIPALVAGVIIRVMRGKGAVKTELFSRRSWQIRWGWAAAALAAGIGLRVLVSAAGLLVVPGYEFRPGAFSPLLAVTFLFAAGEQAGWRGFALPALIRQGVRPLTAALLLGVPWAFLHIPLTFPGKLSDGTPAAAQFLIILSISVITAWLYLAGNGSLAGPVLFHGSQNAAVILNDGLPAGLNSWLMVLAYGGFALLVILLTRGRLGAGSAPAGTG